MSLPQATTSGPPGSLVRARKLWVEVGAFYLGLALTLPALTLIETQFISSELLVALLLAFEGLRTRAIRVDVRPYAFWALAFTVWMLLSGISVWEYRPVYHGVTLGVWLLVVVPGLSCLWTSEFARRAFVVGLVLGVSVLAVIAIVRLVTGSRVEDGFEDGAGLLFGLNRNGVNLRAVFAIPFLLNRSILPWPVAVRGGILALLGTWIVTGGGRSGLLTAAAIVIIFAAMQPGAGRRARALAVGMLVALLSLLGIHFVGGQAIVSTNRMVEFLQGERSSGDEVRDLVNLKARALARENPIFGVGRGNFTQRNHPVTREGSTAHVRRSAAGANAHNTYFDVMATTGYPGLATFVGLLVSVGRLAYRRRTDPAVRVATSGFLAVTLIIAFHSTGLTFLYATSLVLGASWHADHGQQHPERIEDKAPGSSSGLRRR